MHVLHAILVDLSEALGGPLDGFTVDELKDTARDHALHATEQYGDGEVFDWRSEADAGRWSEEFPSNVILGREEPERLIALVQEHSRRPLEEALKYLETYTYANLAWRSKEEIEAEGFVIIGGRSNDERSPFKDEGRV
ncbi:MAG: hypothetical protein ACPLRM_02715, partial [Anaerolineae bacterium]